MTRPEPVWPSERGAFLAWYEAEQPDATGWDAVALYGAHTRGATE
jgi:hypothetical protein